jgi:replicative DNA helicase
MDYENLLINKVCQTGRLQDLMLQGVSVSHFEDDTHKEIWEFMTEHLKKYKQAPSFKTVQTKFPYHNFEIVDESITYLQEQFFKQIKRRNAIDAIRDLATAIDDEEQVGQIDELFLEQSRQLAQTFPSEKVARFSEIDQRIQEYESGEETFKGIKMGIPAFDDITLGIQPHEYVTISGWSGTGKSTLAQWALFNAYMQGETPMLISLEMEARNLFRKWDTMLTNFNYQRLKSHNLREDELERWKSKAVDINNRPNDLIVLDQVYKCTVDKVYAEIVRWKPTIVCIDYISLMNTDRASGNSNWEKIMYLTQNLKQISRSLKVPIIGVAQTNRESATGGAKLENIAWSVAIIQDSDIVIGLHSDEDMRKEKMMEIRMLKNRDGRTLDTNFMWDMDSMSFGPYSETQVFLNKRKEEALNGGT